MSPSSASIRCWRSGAAERLRPRVLRLFCQLGKQVAPGGPIESGLVGFGAQLGRFGERGHGSRDSIEPRGAPRFSVLIGLFGQLDLFPVAQDSGGGTLHGSIEIGAITCGP